MIRKHFAGFAASALALAVSAQAFAGTVTTDGTDIVIKTKSGLEVTTTDKQYSFKLGGRIQADFDHFDGFYTSNNDAGNEGYLNRPGFSRHFPSSVNVVSQTLPVTAGC